MTKDEALDLALEALEESLYATTAKSQLLAFEALTAIKQARALDKMAENARELGLDYEPVAPVQEDWGPGPHECHSLTAAPVQEPVAWRYRGILHDFDPSDWAEGPVTLLYTTPPAAVVNQQLTTKPAAQRQWVGLTDEEITALKRNGERYISSQDFARAVLAKSKEKNNG